MTNMSNRTSCRDEESAVAVISRVVDVTSKRRPNSDNGKTPDWRLKFAGGSVVHVEVTTNTDGAARAFHDAVTQRDGGASEWPESRSACRWTVLLADHDPAASRDVRRVKDMVPNLGGVLAEVESAGGSPADMATRAAEALANSPLFSSPRFADPRRFSPYPSGWSDGRSSHAQNVTVVCDPELVGPGRGAYATAGASCRSVTRGEPVSKVWRPTVKGQWDLPSHGQQNCPVAARSSARRVCWSVVSPPCRWWLG